MKKLKVNTEGCIGCGACVGLDPEHFDFNDEGYSVVTKEENIDSELAQTVVEACPVAVISYEEEEEKCHCKENNIEECHCTKNSGEDCQNEK